MISADQYNDENVFEPPRSTMATIGNRMEVGFILMRKKRQSPQPLRETIKMQPKNHDVSN